MNSLGMALRTKDDLNKKVKILNLRSLNALRDQGKVVGRHQEHFRCMLISSWIQLVKEPM